MPLVSRRVHTCECDALSDHWYVEFVGKNRSTKGETDLLWCITTMSSFSTPPLDEWWISSTQTHSVQFSIHLHCRDMVHAVQRLRCDGFDVFSEKSGWECIAMITNDVVLLRWQTTVILYELTMVGTVFEQIQCNSSRETHCSTFVDVVELELIVPVALCDECRNPPVQLWHTRDHLWIAVLMVPRFRSPHKLLRWRLARPDSTPHWQSTPANPSWLPVWKWHLKLSFYKFVHVANVNWLEKCLFSRLNMYLS